jgi:hypothetical protein
MKPLDELPPSAEGSCVRSLLEVVSGILFEGNASWARDVDLDSLQSFELQVLMDEADLEVDLSTVEPWTSIQDVCARCVTKAAPQCGSG